MIRLPADVLSSVPLWKAKSDPMVLSSRWSASITTKPSMDHLFHRGLCFALLNTKRYLIKQRRRRNKCCRYLPLHFLRYRAPFVLHIRDTLLSNPRMRCRPQSAIRSVTHKIFRQSRKNRKKAENDASKPEFSDTYEATLQY